MTSLVFIFLEMQENAFDNQKYTKNIKNAFLKRENKIELSLQNKV